MSCEPSTTNTLSWIEDELRKWRHQGLERTLQSYAPSRAGALRQGNHTLLNLSSNDYLNLSEHETVLAEARKALDQYGSGTGAARLVTGSRPIHDELEALLAKHKGYEASLVFGSGYMANAGVLTTIARRGDIVFADALVHASILDAIVLSRAKLVRFRHNDSEHLAELLQKHPPTDRSLIVTESVFSMDGDRAPLQQLARLAKAHHVMLMVDEAHATGVFGPCGSGLVSKLGLQSDVHACIGTMSKAIGSYGGYVACSASLRKLLIHKARSFIYTTAPPPSAIGASLGALKVLRREPHLGASLIDRAERFKGRLQKAGFNTLSSSSQIIPLLIGEPSTANAISQRLRERGLLAAAMRPPTVPQGLSRLRLSITYALNEQDLDRAFDEIVQTSRTHGVIT